MESSYPHVAGDRSQPHAGRAWVRFFPSGQVEALYKSHSPDVGEREVLNAWFEDCGSDQRIIPRASTPWPGEAPEKPERAQVESNAERSARRARQAVRWKIKTLGADHLVTLTTRENIEDYRVSLGQFRKFVALCRREWSEFAYVACPERQKRGAWHWHLALRGRWSYDKLRGFWWRAMGSRVVFSADGKPVLCDGGLTPGNIQGVYGGPRRAEVWEISRLAAYLGKYVGKSIGAGDLAGSASYSASRGLEHSIRKYVVRGLGFSDVAEAWLGILDEAGLVSPFLWQAPDRRVLWASGACSAVE